MAATTARLSDSERRTRPVLLVANRTKAVELTSGFLFKLTAAERKHLSPAACYKSSKSLPLWSSNKTRMRYWCVLKFV